MPKLFVQLVKANALPTNQSDHQIQCFECQQWGHKKADCPNKTTRRKSSDPLCQLREKLSWIAIRINPREKSVKINYVSVKAEGEEQTQIYATLDPSGCNCHYTILEAQGDYEGKSLTFLIDFGSSHSFISPSTAKRLRVEAHPTGKKRRASLANGSSILTDEQIQELSFQLGGNPTS